MGERKVDAINVRIHVQQWNSFKSAQKPEMLMKNDSINSYGNLQLEQ